MSRSPNSEREFAGTTEQVGGSHDLFSSFNQVSGTLGDFEYLADYSRRQQAILRHIRQAVKPGGYLLLITCSVFREENESNVSFLETLGCTAVRTEIFSGYAHKADTLFGALMTVPTSGATGAWF